MSEKIEFPFEPSEKVKAAFRNENKMKIAVELMTRALADVLAESLYDPFEMLRKEHPEVLSRLKKGRLSYNHLTQTIDIKPEI